MKKTEVDCCPNCLGMKEVYNAVTDTMDLCVRCLGSGVVPKVDEEEDLLMDDPDFIEYNEEEHYKPGDEV